MSVFQLPSRIVLAIRLTDVVFCVFVYRRLHDASPPEEVLKQATGELRKLRKMTEQAPAYGSTRGWIECVASLPWAKEAASDSHEVAMAEARAVLDEEHYGLDKVKDRIVEYLAVRRLRPEARPPILCFTGPPGVGKTTLARSIAKVLSRPFQRISLGGVRDEVSVTVQPALKYVLPNYHLITNHPPPPPPPPIRLTFEATGGRT